MFWKKMAFLWLATLAIGLQAKYYIEGNTTKNPLQYKVGEQMVFKFTLMKDGKPVEGKRLQFFVFKDDGSPKESFARTTSTKPIEYKTSISKPGFVRVQIIPQNQDGSDWKECPNFDGSACAGYQDVVTLVKEPEDFDAFWSKWIGKLEATQPEVKMTPLKSDYSGVHQYEFTITTLPGFEPATGIIAYPLNAAPKSLEAVVAFDGYHDPSPCSRPDNDSQKMIVVYVNRQGISNTGSAEYYKSLEKKYDRFLFRNNDSPEKSDFLGMILRDMRGVMLVKSLPEFNGKVRVSGGSMGAFRSIAMAALEPSISRAGISVPWCCDLSGITFGRIRGWRPNYTPALRYFDPVFMARRIHCPVYINAGLGDYVSPPSSVLAFFNALAGKATLIFTQSMKHGSGQYPDAPRYLLAKGFAPVKRLLQPIPELGDLRTYPFKMGGSPCTVEMRDGHTILCVDVKESEASRGGTHFILYPDPKALVNRRLCLRVKYRTINVSEPPQVYLGSKFMLTCEGGPSIPTGYFDAWLPQGTNDWQYSSIYQKISPDLNKHADLSFGMQSVHGRIEFDLDTLECGEIYTAATRKNLDYVTHYSPEIANAQLRGVMSPGRDLNEDDLKTLHQWNVNLVRVQFMRNWLAMNTEMDLTEYFQWLDKKLDAVVKNAKIARKYGINFVLDMHSPPGGKGGWYNMRIFSEPKYTEAYLEAWRRIVTRVKDEPAIFGYDLINEPFQGMPSEDSGYFDLQVRAAKEIRKIDPKRAIFVTTLGGGSSGLPILSIAPMDNIIYTVHTYWPDTYTMQNGKKPVVYPGMVDGAMCDKNAIREHFKPLREFQLKHKVRIYIGEFSAKAFAPGAEKWLKDMTDVFEEYGWMYSYHAFREWAGWSLEHDGTNAENLKPVPMTARLQTMLRVWSRNKRNAKCIFDK